jgi:hypothetical protein
MKIAVMLMALLLLAAEWRAQSAVDWFDLRANDIVRRPAVHADGDIFSWWIFQRRPPRRLSVTLQKP